MTHWLLAAIIGLWCVTASAQQPNPSINSNNTGSNNGGGGSGGNCGTLGGQLSGTCGNATVVGPLNGGLVFGSLGNISNANSIWTTSGASSPTYISRLMIGAASAVNLGNAPENPQDWLNTLAPGITQNGQLVSLSPIGLNGIVGASRSSDYHGGVTASIGLVGYGINDNATYADGVWAGYLEANRASAALTGGTYGLEIDAGNASATVVSPTPYSASGNSQVNALRLAAGGAITTSAASSAAIEIVTNPQVFEKGIVFAYNALDSANGSGGTGVALEFASPAAGEGQELTWTDSSSTERMHLWGSVTGLVVANSGAGNVPPTEAGTAFGLEGNLSNGSREINFWNLNTSEGGFTFDQKTGVSSYTQLASLTVAAMGVAVPLNLTGLASGGTFTQAVCLTAAGSLQGSNAGCGVGSGFPITIGSTSIASGSTTTSIAGLTLTGAAVNGTIGATTPAAGTFSAINDTGLTASLPVFTDGSKNLTSTAPAGYSAVLSGTTGSIGGSLMTAGSCVAGTATVTGATSSMVATTSPSGDPDSTLSTGVSFYAFVSSANTVTVRLCALVAVTPAAQTYNVRVLQ
jgi:hypothetical protein